MLISVIFLFPRFALKIHTEFLFLSLFFKLSVGYFLQHLLLDLIMDDNERLLNVKQYQMLFL